MRRRFEKFLVRMAGEDYEAFKNCSSLTKRRLLFIGLIICFVFLIGFLSITEAFTEFFHSKMTGFALGLFFGWTLVNIYLLLLYTLTKNMLVPSYINATSKIALMLRVGTITFFAVIVSKPIEHFIFQSHVITEIAVKRNTDLEGLILQINRSYKSRIDQQINQGIKDRLRIQRGLEILKIKKIISHNNYYLESLRVLSNKGWPWVITLIITSIFLLPIYLKRLIDPTTNYYLQKRRNERDVVVSHYKSFKKEYENIVNSFTSQSETLYYSEPYSDPPFNFKHKRQNFSFSDQTQFLEEIHG